MKIIAHRGYWIDPLEKNTRIAFSRALEYGFGIETDFRDLNGQLVISHDLPLDGAMKLDEFINLYKASKASTPLAFNVKADNLSTLIKHVILRSDISNYFMFDMAVPDMRKYLSEGMRVFTRMSDYELYPVFLNESHGVWLDAFASDWYDMIVIEKLLSCNKQLAIVSPELHQRPYIELWRFLKANNLHHNDHIAICTDFPLKAEKYFND